MKHEPTEIREEDIPERWRGIPKASTTDTDIEDFIQYAYSKGKSLHLGIPYCKESHRLFFGLFHCQRCGDCCLGVGASPEEGISLSPEEVQQLASMMLLSKHKFKDRFTFTTGDGRRLLKYPCPFYQLNSCTIYQSRPYVCRTYPINNPIKLKGISPVVDEVYSININLFCPESRRVTYEVLKILRAIIIFRGNLSSSNLRQLEDASASLWQKVRQEQSHR